MSLFLMNFFWVLWFSISVEPSEKSVEIMRKFSEQYARRSGTYFCSDKGVTSVVIKVFLTFHYRFNCIFSFQNLHMSHYPVLIPPKWDIQRAELQRIHPLVFRLIWQLKKLHILVLEFDASLVKICEYGWWWKLCHILSFARYLLWAKKNCYSYCLGCI